MGRDHLLPSDCCWQLKHKIISAEAVPEPRLGLQGRREVIDPASPLSGLQASCTGRGSQDPGMGGRKD